MPRRPRDACLLIGVWAVGPFDGHYLTLYDHKPGGRVVEDVFREEPDYRHDSVCAKVDGRWYLGLVVSR